MMYSNEINPSWVDAFGQVFMLCAIRKNETIVVLSESGSRPILIDLTKQALSDMGLQFRHVCVPTPAPEAGPIIRSTGASLALDHASDVLPKLTSADIIIDITVEGLMHARQTAQILKSGARILNISNEHPDILCRLVPTEDDKHRPKPRSGNVATPRL